MNTVQLCDWPGCLLFATAARADCGGAFVCAQHQKNLTDHRGDLSAEELTGVEACKRIARVRDQIEPT